MDFDVSAFDLMKKGSKLDSTERVDAGSRFRPYLMKKVLRAPELHGVTGQMKDLGLWCVGWRAGRAV